MKNLKTTIVFALAANLLAPSSHAHDSEAIPLITVMGSAKIQVAPDTAEFVFGVETRSSALTEATSANETRTKSVVDALKKLGVESRDLQMDQIEVEPSFGQNDTKTRPVFYSVSRRISVKLSNLTKFEEALTTALKAGATHVHSAELQSSELRRHKDEARVQSIRAAREKATLLAKEMDVRVGKAFQIREVTSDWYAPARNIIQNSFVEDRMSTSTTTGMIEISAQIEVSFRLE